MTVVRVDLDLAISGGPVRSRLHVGYAWAGERVVAAVVDGGPVEVRVLDVAQWRAELESRLLRVPTSVEPTPAPARVLDLPWDLLVGTGEALARHRDEVYDALVARHGPRVLADGAVLDVVGASEQLGRLHHGVIARLQAVAFGRHRGRGRIGWTSWLLFGDGWRELVPYVEPIPGGGRLRMVRVEPRRPADLATFVARWASAVRS